MGKVIYYIVALIISFEVSYFTTNDSLFKDQLLFAKLYLFGTTVEFAGGDYAVGSMDIKSWGVLLISMAVLSAIYYYLVPILTAARNKALDENK